MPNTSVTKTSFDPASLPTFVGAVAALLGWQHKPNAEDGRFADNREGLIVHPDGREIRLTLTDNGARLVARGLFGHKLHAFVPRDHAGNSSIGIGATKSAAQVAADIDRRLIPAYTEAWTVTQEAHRQACTRRDSDLKLAKDLAAVAPSAKVRSNRYGRPVDTNDLDASPVVNVGYYDATISHGKVSFQRLDGLSPATAKLIIAALAKEPK